MSSVLSVYAICVVILFFKMLAISGYQGYFRLRFVIFTNPEDAAVFKQSAHAEERPEVTRGAQAWRNDLENIPLFIALGGLAIALNASALGVGWMCSLFTAARVLHTLFYLARVQPWRTVSYAVGIVSLIGLVGLIITQVVRG